jgi:hypothetical protein
MCNRPPDRAASRKEISMIAIHILALMIGAFPIYLTLTGKLRGGSIDPATGEHKEGGAAAVAPAIAGLIVVASALGGILR